MGISKSEPGGLVVRGALVSDTKKISSIVQQLVVPRIRSINKEHGGGGAERKNKQLVRHLDPPYTKSGKNLSTTTDETSEITGIFDSYH